MGDFKRFKEFKINNGVLTEYKGAGGEVTIPEGIQSIGRRAFCACSELYKIKIPEGVQSIGDSAFSGCDQLIAISIPEGIQSIGDSAFSGCRKLKGISIPNSVREIGEGAFWGCESLTTVSIPEGVRSIGDRAFEYTAVWNDSENWENGVLYIGKHLISADKSIRSCNIKAGTVSIGSYAFAHCYNLTTVSIPEGVQSIGDSAFSGCSGLEILSIPQSVADMREESLWDCSAAVIAPHLSLSEYEEETRQKLAVGFALAAEGGREISEERREEYLEYIRENKKYLFPLVLKVPALLRLMLAEKMVARDELDTLQKLVRGGNDAGLAAELLEYGRKLTGADMDE